MGRSLVWLMLAVAGLACGEQRDGPADESGLQAGAGGSTASGAGPVAGTDGPPNAGSLGNAGSDPGRTPNAAGGGGGARASNPPLDPLDAGLVPAAPREPPAFEHTFAELTIAAGEEQSGVCQSWTLGNEQAFFVNRVDSINLGAFHHSNWIWVDEASYPGDDGTWPCADRGFDQILAAAGGGVFFAQSTQSLKDTQAFPEGVAFEVPAHARIIGDVHMLNPSDVAAKTSLRFALYTIPESEVRVKLQPMAFTNTALEVVPGGETTAHMQCAMPQPDFDVYYVLPHYHGNGRELRIDVAGGPMDGANVFSSDGAYGEALGTTFDPPIAVTGAEGLVISCDYTNLGSQVLGYGNGDQEMCVVLVYSTGAKAGGMGISALSAMDVGGVHVTDALCVSIGVP